MTITTSVLPPSSSGPGHRPLTAETGVRLPLGVLLFLPALAGGGLRISCSSAHAAFDFTRLLFRLRTSTPFVYPGEDSMPVRVKCPSCKKVLQAPSKYRGKKICCPGCKEPLIVPTLNTIDETALLALGTPEPPPPPIPEPTAPTDTVECPFCSEEIKPSARGHL